MPYFDPELKKLDKSKIDERILTQDEFLQWLYEVTELYLPDMPPFELIQGTVKMHNKEICLTAFVDEALGEMVDYESACNAYHSLPYGGGIFDQPQLLLDAFAIIRGERNRYERVRADKMMDKIKAGDSKSSSKAPNPRAGFKRPKTRR